MQKILFLFVAVVMFIMFAGCAAKGAKFSGFEKPKEGNSKVYIYRTSFWGAAFTHNIHRKNLDTGESITLGEVKPLGYVSMEMEPGSYEFWTNADTYHKVQINTKANETYCVEHYMIGAFSVVNYSKFQMTPMEKCEKEIIMTNLSIKK